MRRCALAILVLLLVTGNSGFAQGPRRSAAFDQPLAALPSRTQQQPARVGNLILGGLIGGAVGFFAGGFAGAVLNDRDDDPDELDALAGFVVGAIVGETVTLPLGVHLANKRRGNFGQSLLASAAATAVGLFIATRGEDHPEAVIPIPIIQLGASVIIEQKTTR
jgi:hypothetical protein